MIDRKDWPEDARNAQAAFDEASWDAVEGYRDTGEMVPGMKDGKLYLFTFDEALRTRPDYEMRKKDVGEWRRNKLIAQVFYDMHIIEHYGSGVRRIKDDCDKNGNPYPVWKSARGEFQVKFPSRTVESVAKLGIDPEKLGVSSIVTAAKNQENKAEPSGGTVVKDPGTVVKDPGTVMKDPETVVKQQNIREDGATAGEKIIRLIIENPKITRHELAMATALSVRGVEYNLKVLKAANRIRRVGPDKGGHWEVCECR